MKLTLSAAVGYIWRAFSLVFTAGSLLACVGCALEQRSQKPALPPGADSLAFKEAPKGWSQAAAQRAGSAQPWWQAFGDPHLDALVEQANAANQSLEQARAQYSQAQALVRGASAAYFPTAGAAASVGRARTITAGVPSVDNAHSWSLSASWEPDLWGGVHEGVLAAKSNAAASLDDLAAARLTVQAAVVADYTALHLDDEQQKLYAQTIEGYRKSLALTQAQQQAGVASGADVALARNTLAQAQAQAVELGLARKQLEHALAVLLGQSPSAFSESNSALKAVLPAPPPTLPSQLLERRPDIAGALQRVAAANAQLGVAQSAFYPNLTLSAGGGYGAGGLGPWFFAPSRVWALGAALAATIFDGGARSAQEQGARAALDAASSVYRQTVLGAFEEVEDNLAALGDLAQERQAQEQALSAAQESERIFLAQYRAGTAPYTAVVTAQALTLTAEGALISLRARQFAASVALIKALGGGWQEGLDAPPATLGPLPSRGRAPSQREPFDSLVGPENKRSPDPRGAKEPQGAPVTLQTLQTPQTLETHETPETPETQGVVVARGDEHERVVWQESKPIPSRPVTLQVSLPVTLPITLPWTSAGAWLGKKFNVKSNVKSNVKTDVQFHVKSQGSGAARAAPSNTGHGVIESHAVAATNMIESIEVIATGAPGRAVVEGARSLTARNPCFPSLKGSTAVTSGFSLTSVSLGRGLENG